MTDQRYTGPDGAKRLELREELESALLEELEAAVGPWRFRRDRLPRVVSALSAIDRYNERVDRLAEEHQAFQAKQGTRPRRLIGLPDR